MANYAKVTDLDYIQFLLCAQCVFSCVEAAKTDGAPDDPPAHDAYTRLLSRQPPDTEALWQETTPFVEKEHGLLVLDDTTLDKPYAKRMDLVHKHWSGKHHKSVWGISLLTLLWTDGGAKLPIDCRISNEPNDGIDKNQHFRTMLQTAKTRGFSPEYVCFDSWYATLENLKAVREHGWYFLARLKSNRIVNPDRAGNQQIYLVDIPPQGRIVHLRGFGLVKVFVTLDQDMEEVAFWATNDLSLTAQQRDEKALCALAIEEYHRGLKQCCGVERCSARTPRSQRNHIVLSLRAFVRLEYARLQTGRSWYESKKQLLREAMRAYRANPIYTLSSTA